ncbi:MAG: hypothetical protein WC205_14440 [Opitutaceae bacterium]|jgi:hypothetical protein
MINPKKSEIRISKVLSAWETLRPAKSFAGMTLAEFKAKLQPSLDTRTAIAALDNQLIAGQNQRDDADKESLDAILLLVNAVKGDPAEGEDGEFYESLGYVRKSERKSGLSRGKRPAAIPA